MTRMDKHGDRFERRNGKWVKVSRQSDKRYTVVRGYEGEIECVPNGITINVRLYDWAKQHARRWLDEGSI